MYRKQQGFTLVEIAIVLVIIGLLLGGVLKGQELINSAKVKNFAQDFRNVPLFIYGYQDKYKALPGDDAGVTGLAAGRFGTSGNTCTPDAASHCAKGNGVIDGVWTANSVTDESFVFWQHIRLAGFAAGPTSTADATYIPRNADGGLMGIESGSAATGGAYISGLTPTYLVCSTGILGKYAKQLDTTLDDGNTATGSMRVVALTHARGSAALATSAVDDSTSFIVCMGL
ncbi:prepilin-type N-terminal cleavage/methylation domain-containing protein [Sulfurisoma sediminicola]|uniref:Prepilin-type N-terminal cleavage/methylation domain-containing protein n=1 Tax=Sulfurisoma sediminicola TaxID=1381557 RepID=A0A497XB09_9PROT|nr:prepilin-type N-terminal cleavage/methylation domain-containing protein [Sulfurisoma sediminicola]RLJ63755.1 prepilin-type N-terminal cleavage/methylation domain-containing protein [Sulfurisoma sediminicola]